MKNSSKIIYFDNGCRICRIGAKAIGAAKLNNGNALTPLQEMDENVSCNIDKARYCNEIAVYDTSTNETRYGVKGMLWVLEERFGKVVRLFSLPIIFHLINFFYHNFSFNRRMIAPVYKKVDDDCEPEFHWGYRLGYIGLILSFVFVFSGWKGLLFFFFPIFFFFGVISIMGQVSRKMEYLGHLTSIGIQLFCLDRLKSLLFVIFDFGVFFMPTFLILIILFYSFSFYVHQKRIQNLGLNKSLTIYFVFTLMIWNVVYTFLLK